MCDWNVSRRTIEFFEHVLEGHSCVASFVREREIVFHIDRTEGRSEVTAVLVGLYTIGLANVFEICRQFPDADCIVTSSKWNSYTTEAKDYGRQNGIGIFDMAEFFGALNWRVPYKYVKKDDRGRPNQSSKSA